MLTAVSRCVATVEVDAEDESSDDPESDSEADMNSDDQEMVTVPPTPIVIAIPQIDIAPMVSKSVTMAVAASQAAIAPMATASVAVDANALARVYARRGDVDRGTAGERGHGEEDPGGEHDEGRQPPAERSGSGSVGHRRRRLVARMDGTRRCAGRAARYGPVQPSR